MILRRLTGIAACALLSTVALATPAYAADSVTVNLGGVSGTVNAGSGADTISVTVTNRTNASITSIQGVFTIQLTGMPTGGVRIVRVGGSELPASGGGGTVTLADPGTFELLRSGRRTISYQLQFTATAPAGKASISYDAVVGGNRLGGASASVTVRSNAPQQSSAPPTTPANTDPGLIPTFASGPSVSLAPLDEEAANTPLSGDVPISLYVMGGLLVVVGGVVLWLLFRRDKPVDVGSYPTSAYPQVRPPSLGYPRHSAARNPTSVLPVVRDPEPPTLPGPPRYTAPPR